MSGSLLTQRMVLLRLYGIVNLSIDSGDIYGIIGMSGAGKSTLVRCMNFLEVPTEGRVLIDGKSLGDFSERELQETERRDWNDFPAFQSSDAEVGNGQCLFPILY